MRVTVNVTPANIAAGYRQDGESCPIALAVRDAIPGLADVEVRGPYIAIWFDDVPRRFGDQWTEECPAWRALTLEAARIFVLNFDRGRPVEPIVFELDFSALSDPSGDQAASVRAMPAQEKTPVASEADGGSPAPG